MAKDIKLTEDQIKAAGGEKNLRRAGLPLDDIGQESLEVIICVPNRRTMAQYQKYSTLNPGKAQEILVKNCLLTDKDQVLNDDALFFTCVGAIAELIPIRESTIKKF